MNSLDPADFITPDWVPSDGVHAMVTTRAGGVSGAPYDDPAGGGGMNLGLGCGDELAHVQANRQRLAGHIGVPICWLDQQHGVHVVTVQSAERLTDWRIPQADAAVTGLSDVALAILSADCLPILLAADGVLGAAHAGWRGLAAGVIENTIQAMRDQGARPDRIRAWLGPAIGPSAFEVGGDVHEAFCLAQPSAAEHFTARTGHPGKWFANLYGLARDRLVAQGIARWHGAGYCTHSDAERFYSYRRDGRTGRMATLIWRKT